MIATEIRNRKTQRKYRKAGKNQGLCYQFTLQSGLVGFFRRAFLEGNKVGIAGHTSTQAHATAQKVKKGNTTQLYGEGDPEGRFCRSPGWRMRRSVRVGRRLCTEKDRGNMRMM